MRLGELSWRPDHSVLPRPQWLCWDRARTTGARRCCTTPSALPGACASATTTSKQPGECNAEHAHHRVLSGIPSVSNLVRSARERALKMPPKEMYIMEMTVRSKSHPAVAMQAAESLA